MQHVRHYTFSYSEPDQEAGGPSSLLLHLPRIPWAWNFAQLCLALLQLDRLELVSS